MDEDDAQPSRGQLIFLAICALVGTLMLILPGIRIG
jgi:hypothetical protein